MELIVAHVKVCRLFRFAATQNLSCCSTALHGSACTYGDRHAQRMSRMGEAANDLLFI